mmetsp:Transcript_44736/g.93866  ORF Transcript_44736/g.93866 Transcript_44736/m.93866 type:complete len:129 (-) Transcript_44736:37-423(-)
MSFMKSELFRRLIKSSLDSAPKPPSNWKSSDRWSCSKKSILEIDPPLSSLVFDGGAVVVFGSSTSADIFYVNELRQLAIDLALPIYQGGGGGFILLAIRNVTLFKWHSAKIMVTFRAKCVFFKGGSLF